MVISQQLRNVGFAICLLASATLSLKAEILAQYNFEGDANDSSGFGFHGELQGAATIEAGRLSIPGGLDDGVSISLGEFNPFSGDYNWTLSFEFQSADEGTGSLFSSDGSAICVDVEDEEACTELWPDGEETGLQTGSLNVFLSPEGTVNTDFWFIDFVASQDIYNDDELHTYEGSYDAESGEFFQVIDGEDEAFGVFIFERDATQDRTFIADESNGDFGFEINPEGFNGFIDNLVIDSIDGPLPEPTGPVGDFDLSGDLDVADVNLLNQEIAGGQNTAGFDLNGDTLVDIADLKVWIGDLKNTWIGDANLDGEFTTTDFVEAFTAGKFEQDVDATWDEGDWTGDLRFNTSDFVEAFQDGGFELGMRPEVQPVPEPSTFFCVAIFALVQAASRRRCP